MRDASSAAVVSEAPRSSCSAAVAQAPTPRFANVKPRKYALSAAPRFPAAADSPSPCGRRSLPSSGRRGQEGGGQEQRHHADSEEGDAPGSEDQGEREQAHYEAEAPAAADDALAVQVLRRFRRRGR